MEKVRLVRVYVINAVVESVDGPWVRFVGSQERLHLGDHDFKIGDQAEIRIKHVPPSIQRSEV